MPHILYYHGLDSVLSNEKREILEMFGTVTAQHYNYRDEGVLANITETFDETKIDDTVVIGSSFGGYVAQMLAMAYGMPCLLFNPALSFRSIDTKLDIKFDTAPAQLSYIVLGRKDDVVNCADNLAFITSYIKEPKKICIEEEMEHRIPIDIFEKHVKQFF